MRVHGNKLGTHPIPRYVRELFGRRDESGKLFNKRENMRDVYLMFRNQGDQEMFMFTDDPMVLQQKARENQDLRIYKMECTKVTAIDVEVLVQTEDGEDDDE